MGYGNIRRSDVTGSIASVSSESISKVASASVADALAGKMAGVQITTTDGALDAKSVFVYVVEDQSLRTIHRYSWSTAFRLMI